MRSVRGERLKTGGGNLDGVRPTNLKVGKDIVAMAVRLCRCGDTGTRIHNRDRGIRNDGSARVGYGTVHGPVKRFVQAHDVAIRRSPESAGGSRRIFPDENLFDSCT